jgi:hypothetical protein
VLTDLEGDLDRDSTIPDLEYDHVDQELVPDAPDFEGQRMRDIVLGCNHCSPHAFVYCHEDNIDHDSMPGLFTASKSSNDGNSDDGSLPGLQSISSSSNGSYWDNEEPYDPNSDHEDLWSAVDDIGVEPFTTTFTTAMLAGEGTTTRGVETELYDSGASRHMTPFRVKLTNYAPISPRAITAADGRTFPAIGKGDMEISVPNGKSCTKLLLRGVLHAPSMGLTIVSVGRLDEAGYGIFFRGNVCRIYDDSKKVIGQIPAATNRLYRVEHGDTVSHSTDLSPLEELHRKLGHIAPKAVKRLVKEGIVEGVELDGSEEMGLCDLCEYAKMTRKPIKKE